MKGTEKQIAWANDILAKVTATFNGTLEYLEQQPEQPGKQKAIEEITARRDILATAEYAGDIIDIFETAHLTGDIMHDFREIRACYRVHYANNPEQHRLLMK